MRSDEVQPSNTPSAKHPSDPGSSGSAVDCQPADAALYGKGEDSDSVLLALGIQFEEIAGQLDALTVASTKEYTEQIDELLALMDPIERAIMATPARTIAGLGVKACHVAHVVSEYWIAPIDTIDWDARAVRLLVEAICSMAEERTRSGATAE